MPRYTKGGLTIDSTNPTTITRLKASGFREAEALVLVRPTKAKPTKAVKVDQEPATEPDVPAVETPEN